MIALLSKDGRYFMVIIFENHPVTLMRVESVCRLCRYELRILCNEVDTRMLLCVTSRLFTFFVKLRYDCCKRCRVVYAFARAVLCLDALRKCTFCKKLDVPAGTGR